MGASAACCFILFKDVMIAAKLYSCILIGLVSGVAIGSFTEYSTSYTELPTKNITKAGKTGPATVVIQGLGVGMIGTSVPTVIIVIAICACNAQAGLYGIALAAVGMLSTLAITLATDAYGPVADNARGLAEMDPAVPKHVRNMTDGALPDRVVTVRGERMKIKYNAGPGGAGGARGFVLQYWTTKIAGGVAPAPAPTIESLRPTNAALGAGGECSAAMRTPHTLRPSGGQLWVPATTYVPATRSESAPLMEPIVLILLRMSVTAGTLFDVRSVEEMV